MDNFLKPIEDRVEKSRYRRDFALTETLGHPCIETRTYRTRSEPQVRGDEHLQGPAAKLAVAKESVEGAKRADMAEFDTRDVVGNGTRLLRDGQHAIGRPVQEFRFLFDEARDQSRASAAVDLGPFAGVSRASERHAAQERLQRELLIRLFQTVNIHDMKRP